MRMRHLLLAGLLLAVLSGCGVLNGEAEEGPLVGSGMVAANEVKIAAEISGRVVEIAASEGQSVAAGDILFRVDDSLLVVQRRQSEAAVQAAEAALAAAQAQLEGALLQESLATQGARLQDLPNRAQAWAAEQPAEFNLPAWYFGADERIQAAEEEVRTAEDNLATQVANLEQALQKGSNVQFVQAEDRLAKAQAAFAVAVPTLQQAQNAGASETLLEMAVDAHESALKELEAAQLEYRRILTTTAADEVMEARARVAVGQARLDTARDQVTALQTGERALQVQAATQAVRQAETAVGQAEAGVAQAEAALEMIDAQIVKTTVRAPSAGVVLARNLEVGEIAAAGGVAMTIGRLTEVEVTVYIPEDRYGAVKLGDAVTIQVDSFPNRSYQGTVSHIAGEAEFTPRNVQTVEGRKTTVFAVTVVAANPDLELKPGMPADVTFR
ncbi:MAG: HlyD family efflux transporter periplasmic adaptor subunit [Anaerolineae bacterium]|nr:HlyD family efflux transporter periplasmic adaptor subunit [Anaerolineae bacterium]